MKTSKPLNFLKGVLLFLSVAMMSIGNFSCSKKSDTNLNQTNTNTTSTFERQLNQIIIKQRELNSKGFPLKLVSYTPPEKFKNETRKEEVLSSVTKEDNIFPVFDGLNFSSVQLVRFKEIKNVSLLSSSSKSSINGTSISSSPRNSTFQMEINRNGKENIEKIISDNISNITEQSNLTWDYNGDQFTTVALGNERGIVYDNVISNIVLLSSGDLGLGNPNIHKTAKVESKYSEFGNPNALEDLKLEKIEETQNGGTKYKKFKLSTTIIGTWIFGTERGRATCWITANYVDPLYGRPYAGIADYSYGAESNMEIGTADAQCRVLVYRTELSTGGVSPWTSELASNFGRFIKAEYAMFLATPTATLQIKATGSRYSIDIKTNGIGSIVKAAGLLNLNEYMLY